MPFTTVLSLLAAFVVNATPPANEVLITARDYGFDAPASIPAGLTTFKLVNKGKEIHHAVITRLDEGKTLQDLGMAMASRQGIPGWFVALGGPNAVLDDGYVSNATVDLAPGKYIIMCLVPSPDDHAAHVQKGMVKELIVTEAGAAKAEPVAPTLTMKMFDYNFSWSAPLTAGKHIIRVVNDGPQLHEVALIKLHEGKTPADVGKWAQTEQGPMPASLMGGVSPISKGLHNDIAVHITPGTYMLLCFIPDAKDGKLHLQHGMEQVIEVK